jgi:hypothetical protein
MVTGLALLAWGWPWTEPGLKLVKLEIPKDCKDTAVRIKESAHKSGRDVIVWRFDNQCAETMKALLKPANNAFSCVGEPKAANLGAEFELKARQRAYLVCTVDYPKDDVFDPMPYSFSFTYTVKKVTEPGTEDVTASEIAIEVEP